MKGKQRKIATFDIETDPFKYGRYPKSFAACFYTGKQFHTFWGEDAVLKCLELMVDYDGIIYAHNGGKFDFCYLLEYMAGHSIRRAQIIHGRLARFFYGMAEFRDSYLLLPVPLREFNKDDIDYSCFELSSRALHKKKILDYLENDCYYLHDVLERFIEEYGNALTLGNRSFNEIKKCGYEIPRIGSEKDAYLRKYFFGGRCQAFELGRIRGKFSIYDIKSAYPWAMSNFEHPWSTSYTLGNKIRGKFDFIEFEGEHFGSCPIRNKDGSVIFNPYRGTIRCSYHEYIAGLETNSLRVDDIHEVLTFDHHTNFKLFVDKFYALKLGYEKAGDKIGRQLSKLILNSGFGRFALNCNHFKEYQFVEYGKHPEGNWELVIDYPEAKISLYEKPQEDIENSFFNVATGASITGAVRAYLWRNLCTVRRPVYCDTDSIICESGDRLLRGDALGSWESEGCVLRDQLYIAGKKLYAAKMRDHWKTACKGVDLSHEEIIRISQGETIEHEREAPTFSFRRKSQFVKRKIKMTGKI